MSQTRMNPSTIQGPKPKWLKSLDGWVMGKWRIRGPIWGKPMYWLYFSGSRFTPTGKYDDVVSFPTVKAAKAFVAKIGAV